MTTEPTPATAHTTARTTGTTSGTTGAAADRAPGLDGIGYADAVAELDAILRDLERADVDVDVLAERVQRAAELIAFCRDRVDSARARIDQVVADLDAAPNGDGDA